MDFKENIKKLRKEYNLSQEELAKKIGVARSSVANYENGQNFPNMDILLKLSEVFNCTTDYLLGKSDIRNPEKIEVDLDSIKIGLSAKDYENITDNQKEYIRQFAELVLKDNKKKKENK